MNISNVTAAHFRAEWPKFAPPTICERIARIVRACISFILTPLTDKASEFVVMNSSWEAHSSKNLKVLAQKRQYLEKVKGGTPLKLETPDGLLLDGMIFKGTSEKAIAYFGGNAEYYENTAYMLPTLRKTFGDVSVIFINPRGVAESEGPCSPDLLQWDAYTAMEYLIQKNHIEPGNIIPIGRSLGASYGTIGASILQKKYPDQKIGMATLVPFTDLPTTVEHIVADVSKTLGDVSKTLGKIAAAVIRCFGWTMNTKAAWETLKGPRVTVAHHNDGIIHFPASLCANTEQGHKIIHGTQDGSSSFYAHNLSFDEDMPLIAKYMIK